MRIVQVMQKYLRKNNPEKQQEANTGGIEGWWNMPDEICNLCRYMHEMRSYLRRTYRYRKKRHRHDIKKRPDNTELAEHFHTGHDDGDMEVLILEFQNAAMIIA